MTSKILLAAAAVAAAVCVANPAFACKGPNILFEDNFNEADDSAWGDISEIGSIGEGVMKINAKKDYIYHLLYQGDAYEKADMCVDVAMLSKGDAGAGLIFAAQSTESYYWFWVNPLGLAGVQRLNNKKWFAPVPARRLQLSGEKATIRVTLDGAHATAYVNDQKFADFKVSPVEGGGYIGLGANAGESDLTWGFSKLKITDLPQ